jgi:hypothetical protein
MSNAQNTNRRNQRRINVRQAHVPTLTYEEMSDLGRDLYNLSREYEASGEKLLTENEVENEITLRRGGFTQDDAI